MLPVRRQAQDLGGGPNLDVTPPLRVTLHSPHQASSSIKIG